MNINDPHSKFHLKLVMPSGNEVIVQPPLMTYTDGAENPLQRDMKVSSVNSLLSKKSTTAITGKSGEIHSLPAESYAWIDPSVKAKEEPEDSTGKFNQSLVNKKD